MNPSEDSARRRRRRSQTHASDVAVGVIRRRSPRLHPQVHPSEEGDGAARRRSPRPRYQTRGTGEGAGVIRRSFPAALASPIEDEDLLMEILLRLPRQPSSLIRASAVCKQWRCAATDPKFLRRFRLHHRKPPLLGLFHQRNHDIVFTPTMDRPDRIPPKRFNLHQHLDSHNMGAVQLLDCRHGRVLLTDKRRDELILCDPIIGEQRLMAVPPEFVRKYFNGTVLCAAIDHDHVHESCHSSPFKVVLIYLGGDNQLTVCVYSSETGVWGDIISTTASYHLSDYGIPGLLVGNSLYWLLDIIGAGILKFDLDEQSLAVIKGPLVTNDFSRGSCIIQDEDGTLGFAILSYPHLQMWQRNIICHGVATWVLWKTIDMRTILGLPKQIQGKRTLIRSILGCLEDCDEILLSVDRGAYMVQLKSMKSRKLCENSYLTCYHSFKSFYPPGTSIAGGCDGNDACYT
ncbi:hypothetical protein CFC21_039655, partial [Triticum aestivum]